jgi:hypothetical protein
MIMLPQATHAQSQEEMQMQLKALMEQVRTLQAQIAQKKIDMGSSTPMKPEMGMAREMRACPMIARALRRGSNGEDVKKLQQFLIESGRLREGNMSGTFGPATEQALKEWQSQEGIVSNGSAETTGWGSLGAKTREAIQKRCGNPDKMMPKGAMMHSGTTTRPEWRPDNGSTTMPYRSDGAMMPGAMKHASGTHPMMPISAPSGTPPMKYPPPMHYGSGTPPMMKFEAAPTGVQSMDAQSRAQLASALSAVEGILKEIISVYAQ